MTHEEIDLFIQELRQQLLSADSVQVGVRRGVDDVTNPTVDTYVTRRLNDSLTVTIEINGGAHDRDMRSIWPSGPDGTKV